MGNQRRRKSTVAEVVRPHLDADATQHIHRVVSVHRTATGRLGQSTTFISRPNDVSINAEPKHSIALENFDSVDTLDDDPAAQGRSNAKLSFLWEWAMKGRDSWLDELMRNEGRAGKQQCARCGGEGRYRCVDCSGFGLRCKNCLVKIHEYSPFHRAQVRPYRGL